MTDQEPNKIFFAKDLLPLVYSSNVAETSGINESFLASDVSALISFAEKYISIPDKHWGWIEKKPNQSLEFYLFDYENRPHAIKWKKNPFQAADISKGSYPHFMIKEIHEQTQVIQKIIKARITQKHDIHFDEISLDMQQQKDYSHMFIISAGTSWHAGLIGKLYIEHFARISTEVDFSSEFRYRNPIVDGDTQVIAISQSGETADTLPLYTKPKLNFLKSYLLSIKKIRLLLANQMLILKLWLE